MFGGCFWGFFSSTFFNLRVEETCWTPSELAAASRRRHQRFLAAAVPFAPYFLLCVDFIDSNVDSRFENFLSSNADSKTQRRSEMMTSFRRISSAVPVILLSWCGCHDDPLLCRLDVQKLLLCADELGLVGVVKELFKTYQK